MTVNNATPRLIPQALAIMKSRMWGDADEAQAEYDALIAVYAAADAAMVFLAENGYGGTPVESALLDALEGCAAVIGEVKS